MQLKVIGIGSSAVLQCLSADQTRFSGQMALFAAYAKRLGASASYLGVLRGDAQGAKVERELRSLGVGMERCRDVPGQTGSILLDKEDLTYLKSFDLAHVGLDGLTGEELEKINRCRVPISFDFSSRGSEAYFREICPHVDYGFVSCGDVSQRAMDEKMNQLFQFGCKRIIALRGARDAVYFDGREKLQYRAPRANPAATGDAFPAGFMIDYLTWQKAARERMISEAEQRDAVLRAMEAGSVFAARIADDMTCEFS